VGTGGPFAETTELVVASGLWQVRTMDAENFGAIHPGDQREGVVAGARTSSSVSILPKLRSIYQ
jgi:hypothetical protein